MIIKRDMFGRRMDWQIIDEMICYKKIFNRKKKIEKYFEKQFKNIILNKIRE